MAGKMLILCFVLAMVTIATCKPRNPFAGLFRRGKLVMAESEFRKVSDASTEYPTKTTLTRYILELNYEGHD